MIVEARSQALCLCSQPQPRPIAGLSFAPFPLADAPLEGPSLTTNHDRLTDRPTDGALVRALFFSGRFFRVHACSLGALAFDLAAIGRGVNGLVLQH